MSDHSSQKVDFKNSDDDPLGDFASPDCGAQILGRARQRGKSQHGKFLRRLLKWGMGSVAAVVVLLAVLLGALEFGVTDGFIRDQAQVALSRASGPDYRSELKSVSLRLTMRGQIGLLAQDVVIQKRDESLPPNRADRVFIALDLLRLMQGHIAVKSIDVSGVRVTAPQGKGFNLTDLAAFRVDGTGEMIEQLFVAMNRAVAELGNLDAGTFRFSDFLISGVGVPVRIKTAEIRRLTDGHYNVEALVERAGHAIHIKGNANPVKGELGLAAISGVIDGLAIDFLTHGPRDRQNGVSVPLKISFTAEREFQDRRAGLTVKVSAQNGIMTMGGIEANLREANINLVYMPEANKIEITKSIIRVGETVLPFTGALIDADRVDKVVGPGIAFDLVVSDGLAAPGDSDEKPIAFQGKALGRFDAAKRFLVADELTLLTQQGSLFGSASWRFVEGISPEINLVAQSSKISTAAVKQFWPYWIGKKARAWVLGNLYGGTVTNASIQLAAPAGHYKPVGDVSFTPDQLKLDFDIERARMNVAGNIPPLRDVKGHMRLRGARVDFAVESGTAFFPTGRSVDVKDGVFTIAETDAHPLMADISMSVSGKADAVAEAITYHPINALDRIGLEPDQLSGNIVAKVTARFGLLREQSPPPPVWSVDLNLKDVDISKPVEGRMLSAMNGSLFVTPQHAELKVEALVDGIKMKLDVAKPIGGSDYPEKRIVSGRLDAAALEKLAPGSAALISGPVGFDLVSGADGTDKIRLDLEPAKLTVPGVNWVKDKGIAAQLSFSMKTKGRQTRLSNIKLSGNGFSASGDVVLKNGRFAQGTFDQIKLAPRDNYRAKVISTGKGYEIEIGGKAVDARSIIAAAKESGRTVSTDNSQRSSIVVSGSVQAVYGYSEEKLTSASVRYKGQGDRIDLLDFKAVTKSEQAVVFEISGTRRGETIQITSGDAGAVARFSGIYSRIQGGLLNIRLKRDKGPLRRGVLDIRNFMIVGEPRLESLVSTPADTNGKSLKDAVKRDLDVSRAKFELANTQIALGNGKLVLSEGVIRGPEIGASFQGTLEDEDDNMDITGTFMPAYGVNRLFSELPIIGAILGNGRDRGLIGITFRLSGKSASPTLQVNPLSAIAPGIFRSIFEFRE